ncbi:hypothetical protein [Candidatus Neptunochlamydia vexilliferae]|uniref:hypothetical protein n=1 Tax=Candidatus Neptunichlamydia vexilliferae TaxID=1651774 RepID=UPI001E2B8EE4|nr:hypothetical protein [Candidatus Neptunochlamydia vexilliferae]
MNMKLPFSSVLRPKLMIQKMGFVGGFYLLLLLPIVVTIFHVSHRAGEIALMKDQVDYLQMRMERVKEMEKGRHAFVKNYGNADPSFMDRFIEPLTFLNPEVEALKLVCNHPAFHSCKNVRERLVKLTEGENRLSFFETGKKVENGVEEAFLVQTTPVEMNVEDLKKTLSMIEGPDGPQLIVRHFKLNKKKLAERETYLLKMELIKRGIAK